MLKGVDVSVYQGSIDWPKVKASGISFAYAKASEGAAYVDSRFNEYHDGAKAAGLAFGAYHFWRPLVDPKTQAQHFATAINGRQGTLAPMVDVEVSDGAGGLVDLLAAFLEALKPLIKAQPIIYTGWSFWNEQMQGSDAFSGHRLWLSEYNNDAAPSLPNGWKTWAIWQHSSSGQVPGISGNVDLDLLNGDDLSLIGG